MLTNVNQCLPLLANSWYNMCNVGFKNEVISRWVDILLSPDWLPLWAWWQWRGGNEDRPGFPRFSSNPWSPPFLLPVTTNLTAECRWQWAERSAGGGRRWRRRRRMRWETPSWSRPSKSHKTSSQRWRRPFDTLTRWEIAARFLAVSYITGCFFNWYPP